MLNTCIKPRNGMNEDFKSPYYAYYCDFYKNENLLSEIIADLIILFKN